MSRHVLRLCLTDDTAVQKVHPKQQTTGQTQKSFKHLLFTSFDLDVHASSIEIVTMHYYPPIPHPHIHSRRDLDQSGS